MCVQPQVGEGSEAGAMDQILLPASSSAVPAVKAFGAGVMELAVMASSAECCPTATVHLFYEGADHATVTAAASCGSMQLLVNQAWSAPFASIASGQQSPFSACITATLLLLCPHC